MFESIQDLDGTSRNNRMVSQLSNMIDVMSPDTKVKSRMLPQVAGIFSSGRISAKKNRL
jgi:hypothetical protein